VAGTSPCPWSTSATTCSSSTRPLADEEAKGDGLSLTIELDGDEVRSWGTSLGKYLERWPDDIWVVEGGPGSVGEPRRPTAWDHLDDDDL
jgi:hypothetical protein